MIGHGYDNPSIGRSRIVGFVSRRTVRAASTSMRRADAIARLSKLRQNHGNPVTEGNRDRGPPDGTWKPARLGQKD